MTRLPNPSPSNPSDSIFQIRYEPEQWLFGGLNQAAVLDRRLNKLKSLLSSQKYSGQMGDERMTSPKLCHLPYFAIGLPLCKPASRRP